MRVLDVGCGSGDVSLLAAELVGRTGEVIGVDRAAAAVDRASQCAQARGAHNIRFLEGDPAELEFDRPFDAVVGRLVLMYYPDPVAALRKLTTRVRSGGLTAFQEIDIANCRSMPGAPLFDRSVELIRRSLGATGARIDQGLMLYPVFMAAGLPGPAMRMDAAIAGGPPSAPFLELVAELIQSLLPAMEQLGIATAAEVDVPSLASRMQDEVVASKGVVISPALVGAWATR
jgi:SAM-dependent methyltransferase